MKPFRVMYLLFGLFLGIGVLFLLLGILIAPVFPEEPGFDGGTMFLAVFGGIGAVFALLGGIGLFLQIRKNRQRKEILVSGMRLAAKITEILPDCRITVNGRHPYRIYCEYREESTSTLHVFKSEPLALNPTSAIAGDLIDVCVDPYDFSKYAVDVDSALGGYRVCEH